MFGRSSTIKVVAWVFLTFLINSVKTPAFFRQLWDPSFQDQGDQSLCQPRGRLDSGPDLGPWIHQWSWHPIQYINFRKVHWSQYLDLGSSFLKLHLVLHFLLCSSRCLSPLFKVISASAKLSSSVRGPSILKNLYLSPSLFVPHLLLQTFFANFFFT